MANVVSLPLRIRYDVALLYLEQSDYNLEAAIDSYKEDEKWEKEHPLDKDSKRKTKSVKAAGMRRFVGTASSASASASSR